MSFDAMQTSTATCVIETITNSKEKRSRSEQLFIYDPNTSKRPKCVISCTWKECAKTFTTTGHMQRHVKSVHEHIKDVKCTWKGCDQLFTDKGHMQRHVKAVHEQIKDVKCTWGECKQLFATNQHMQQHVKAVHEHIKNVKCTWEGCDQVFSRSENMQAHVKEVHQKINVKCTWEGCDQLFTKKWSMQNHVKTAHEQIRDVQCTWEGCNQLFSRFEHMQKHVKAVHQQIKDVKCTWEGCDQLFSTAGDMRSHYVCWHTKKGMNRKKKHEERLRTVLKAHYEVDEEVHIRYRDGCVPDPDKYCSRVDFGVVGIIPAVTIVECDELGHESYLISCECSRMEQTSEAIIKSGETRPIVYIRYNPNGVYTVDGEIVKVKREDREKKLLQVLADLQSGVISFTLPLNIVYLFYSTLDGQPEVCCDPNYSNQLAGCVCVHPTTKDSP
eukprot:5265-Heterococcus_DN1.PRE.23